MIINQKLAVNAAKKPAKMGKGTVFEWDPVAAQTHSLLPRLRSHEFDRVEGQGVAGS
jgi:hypothetical protein